MGKPKENKSSPQNSQRHRLRSTKGWITRNWEIHVYRYWDMVGGELGDIKVRLIG